MQNIEASYFLYSFARIRCCNVLYICSPTAYNDLVIISSGNLPNGQCFTTSDSPDKNTKCILPFKFNGVLRQGCITDTDPDGRHWCSTKVDENLEHIRFPNGYWGYCDKSCPPLISTEPEQQGMQK